MRKSNKFIQILLFSICSPLIQADEIASKAKEFMLDNSINQYIEFNCPIKNTDLSELYNCRLICTKGSARKLMASNIERGFKGETDSGHVALYVDSKNSLIADSQNTDCNFEGLDPIALVYSSN